MSDPRGNPPALVSAGLDNAILAVREGWDVNPGYYQSGPADVQLVTDVASFQEDTRAGRFPGVEKLVIDGRLGPKTKRAIIAVSANAGREAGAVGPDDWPEWWAKSLSFTAKPRDVPVEVIGIPDTPDAPIFPDPVPPAEPANGGGGGGLKALLAVLLLAAAFKG